MSQIFTSLDFLSIWLLCCSGVSGEGSGVTVEGSAPASETIATPPATDTKARHNG